MALCVQRLSVDSRMAVARPAGRRGVVVHAIFKQSSEADKEAAWRAQQERLEERRANRDKIMADLGRAGPAGGRAQAAPAGGKAGKAAPSRPSKRAPEPVVIEEVEEEPAAPAGGNPLSGLLGMFGKKK